MTQPALPTTLGVRAFARLRGWTPGYVTELKQAGRLVLTEDGKAIRVAESLALLEDTADPARAGVVARHAATRSSAPHHPAPPAGRADSGSQGDDAGWQAPSAPDDPHAKRRAKALADSAEAAARKALRDEQLELRQLLRADEVDEVLRGAVVTMRTSLENLPATIAPQLAAVSDEGRIRVLLGEAIEHVLEELSRRFLAVARAGGDA
jgi:hypothetical protein